MENEIVYVTHPCSAERKSEFRKQGLKIIDAAYAPEGVKVEDGMKPVKAKLTIKDEDVK